MESGSPPVDLSTSSEYDDDEVSPGDDDEICFADDPYIVQNFTDLNKIGKGGFGFVYEAVSKHDGKKYAFKFVKLETDLVYREVEVLQLLDHKNIIRYYNHWVAKLYNSNSKASEEDGTSCSSLNISFRDEEEDYSPNENTVAKCTTVTSITCPMSSTSEDDSPEDSYTSKVNNANSVSTSNSRRFKSSEEEHVSIYLIIQTELCQPTVNLEVLIQSKVFHTNENQRRKLFLEIVYGLQHIHDKRIIHRDLKPANILIGIDNQEGKIADFGLARIYEMSRPEGNYTTSKTDNNSLTPKLGTIPYVAPEVLKSTIYSYKADLYSLGILLSEMYLEMGSGRPRIMDRLRTQDFTDLKDLPNEVVEVIISLLSHEPSLRMELERVIDIMSPLKHHQRDGVSYLYHIISLSFL